jgi:hypothetical protein
MTHTATTTARFRRPRPARPEFDVEVSARSPGYNRVQQVARAVCLPALLMGLMGIAAGLGIAIVRGAHIHAQTYSAANLETLRQISQGVMFGGLAFVLAGVSFAIATILGALRRGGGDVQEAAGRTVQVLKRPWTAWAFLGVMMMAMMAVLGAAALHIIWGTDVHGSLASLNLSDKRYTALVGVERLGIGMYLTAIAFGLASIIHVLRFQARRIREVPLEERPS